MSYHLRAFGRPEASSRAKGKTVCTEEVVIISTEILVERGQGDRKARVKQVNDYIWARYVEEEDDYDLIDEDDALRLLEDYYGSPQQDDDKDSVYLGILLFERAFADEERKLDYFQRAVTLFNRYRRSTGDTGFEAVEDRREDILAYFKEHGIELPPSEEPVVEEPEADAAEGGASGDVEAPTEAPPGMVLVPAGPFLFGPENEPLEIGSFYVDVDPVTNEEYNRFCEETRYRKSKYADDPRFNGPRQPVVGISWLDAQQFCKWAGKDLPDEQQWEKAARGSDGRAYPWGNDPPPPEQAVYGQDPETGRTSDVGTTAGNVSPYGCRDMSGNVWQWTSTPAGDNEEFRILKGGSYNDDLDFLRSDGRLEGDPKDKMENVGFRCIIPIR
jgi:sulfatase-modifying factor enzyme 1